MMDRWFSNFSYFIFSNYHHLYEAKEPVYRPFNRDLSFEEIFIRTHLITFPYKRIQLYTADKSVEEKVELFESTFQLTRNDLETDKVIDNRKMVFEPGSPFKRTLDSDIDYLIKYFESTVNEGFVFDLAKCKLESTYQ